MVKTCLLLQIIDPVGFTVVDEKFVQYDKDKFQYYFFDENDYKWIGIKIYSGKFLFISVKVINLLLI
jgi:hypothetical protein